MEGLVDPSKNFVFCPGEMGRSWIVLTGMN